MIPSQVSHQPSSEPPPASFHDLLTLAQPSGRRLVVPNRPGYPGSEPLSGDDRSPLLAADRAADDGASRALAEDFLRARSYEMLRFLCDFVVREQIPTSSGGVGGVVLCGWSLAGAFVSAILANIGAFEGSVDLSRYIRRAVVLGKFLFIRDYACSAEVAEQVSTLLDTSYNIMGYAPPPNHYHPLADDEIPPAEGVRMFTLWLSGYYTHDLARDKLEMKTPDAEPSPTLSRLGPKQVQAYFDPKLAALGEADMMLIRAAFRNGAFERQRRLALGLAGETTGQEDRWLGVPLRYLLCEGSVWEMPWSAICLRRELEEGRRSNRTIREVSIVPLARANHFVSSEGRFSFGSRFFIFCCLRGLRSI